MNKSNIATYLAFLLVIVSSCNFSNPKNCETKEIKTLFTIPGIYEGKITGYSHYTLIDSFSRKCMDSATLVNLALSYIDTVKIGNPVDVLMFFNSDKDFIPNETSQVMEEINKNCLVVIGFDRKTRTPNDYIFYNERGDRVYWGNRWLKDDK